MDRYTRPHLDRAVLLTIDVQNDFTLPEAPAEIPGTMAIVPRIGRLLDAFRGAGAPIVHAVRLYRSDGSNVDPCRRAAIEDGASIVRPGSEGAALVEGIRPEGSPRLDADRLIDGDFQEIGDREWVTYKPRWSAFHGTGLTEFLRSRSVDTVVVAGCNFPNCPRTTIYDATQRDFRVLSVGDAISGIDEQGVRELEAIGVAVAKTSEVIADLS
jgi:nicotinamidase-related amidase